LIAATSVTRLNHGGCSRGGIQNPRVLNVENWDPYGRAIHNIRQANDLRAEQKCGRVQNSNILERHELLFAALARHRSKLIRARSCLRRPAK